MNRITRLLKEEDKNRGVNITIPVSSADIERTLVKKEHEKMEQIRRYTRRKLGFE